MFHYTTKYRPADSFTVPKGFRFVGSGALEPLPLRPELPRSSSRFGVIEYDRKLSDEELSQWEMERVWGFVRPDDGREPAKFSDGMREAAANVVRLTGPF